MRSFARTFAVYFLAVVAPWVALIVLLWLAVWVL
jgi:hypothetical protein